MIADGCQGGQPVDAYKYIYKSNGIQSQYEYPYVSGKTGTVSKVSNFYIITLNLINFCYKVYLFKKRQSQCGQVYSGNEDVAKLTDNIGYFITNGIADEALVTDAIEQVGPLSALVYITANFQFYSSGIFMDSSCVNLIGSNINHAVTIVGYGPGYYILKNQWGNQWGMNGYMYFYRNEIENTNQCSIASFVTYPSVDEQVDFGTSIGKNPFKKNNFSLQLFVAAVAIFLLFIIISFVAIYTFFFINFK